MSKGPSSTSSHFLLESLQLSFRSNQLSETAFRNVSCEHAQPSPTASVLVGASEVHRPQLRQPTPSSFPQTHQTLSYIGQQGSSWWNGASVDLLGTHGHRVMSWALLLSNFTLISFRVHPEGHNMTIHRPSGPIPWFPNCAGRLHEPLQATQWAGTHPPTPHLSCQPGQLCF